MTTKMITTGFFSNSEIKSKGGKTKQRRKAKSIFPSIKDIFVAIFAFTLDI